MPATTLTLYWVRLVLDTPDGQSRIIAELPRRGAAAAQKWRTDTATHYEHNPPPAGHTYRIPLPSLTPHALTPAPAPTDRRRKRRNQPQP